MLLQRVKTATKFIGKQGFNTASGRCCCNFRKWFQYQYQECVSIPQAVGAVATPYSAWTLMAWLSSFNTASGRCCCNHASYWFDTAYHIFVSIPQAVGAVATLITRPVSPIEKAASFNTASGRCCCNLMILVRSVIGSQGFNTASGRCCCNCNCVQETYSWFVSIPQAVGAVATFH